MILLLATMDATSNVSTLTGLVAYAMAPPASAVASRAASHSPCQTHAGHQPECRLEVMTPATLFVSILTGFVVDAQATSASAVVAKAPSLLSFQVTTAEGVSVPRLFEAAQRGS